MGGGLVGPELELPLRVRIDDAVFPGWHGESHVLLARLSGFELFNVAFGAGGRDDGGRAVSRRHGQGDRSRDRYLAFRLRHSRELASLVGEVLIDAPIFEGWRVFAEALRRPSISFDGKLTKDTVIVCTASTAASRAASRPETRHSEPELSPAPALIPPASRPEPPQSFWAVAKTQPQRESWAGEMLQSRGFEVFLPKVETRRSVLPLFVSYVFVLVVDGRWLAIDRTYGVLGCVKFGLQPARCPDYEIEAIRRRADPITGIIRLPSVAPPRSFRRGDRVKILAGPFASFDAIHSGMTRKAREIVLINMLGATRQVEVAPHLVEKFRPGA
jgi:transcriptional antiterminator RfaH